MPKELQGRRIAILAADGPQDLPAFCEAITDELASTPAQT